METKLRFFLNGQLPKNVILFFLLTLELFQILETIISDALINEF